MITIAGRRIGSREPVFIAAELSCNHAGSFRHACNLVAIAAEAGADAVKLQCFTPAEMTCNSGHPAYRLTEGPWKGRSLYDLYVEAHTPHVWFPHLFEYARELGVIAFSSVFGLESLAFLEQLGCPAYKIASAEVTDLELVRAIAATGKPVILSDGMATDAQLAAAMRVVRQTQHCAPNERAEALALRCVSEYPADPASYALDDFRFGAAMAGDFGISDHTITNDAAIAAVALGACFVEKHLMLGWYPEREPLDAAHSVNPRQFKEYVQAIRRCEAMTRSEQPRKIGGSQWRRRLVFARDLPAGHTVQADDLRVARCSEGFELDVTLEQLQCKPIERDVHAGDPVTWHSFNMMAEEVAV